MSSDKWPLPEGEADPLTRRGFRLTAVFAGVVAVGLVAAWLLSSGDPAVATEGSRAPDFEVSSAVEAQSITLTGLLDHGQPIVLNLMASWCGPCRIEIPEISKFSDAHPEVTVVGVAVEDAYADFKEFVSDVKPTYPVAFDDGEMRVSYQSIGLPVTFFINSDGSIDDIYNGILNAGVLEERVAELS